MTSISYKPFINDHELMLYPYAPLGLLHNQGEWPDPKYNLSIVTFASAQDINLIEWLTYHQALGVDRLYLYCIDDDPTELYRQILPFMLGEKPFITFHHYRFSKANAQIYLHFIHNYIHETLWYIHLNINDYLYFHETQKISDFINKFTNLNINVVCFNIFLFNKKDKTNNVLTTKQTTLEAIQSTNSICTDTKFLIRSRTCPYQYIFHHLNQSLDQLIYIDKLFNHSSNVLQQNMKKYYENFPDNTSSFITNEIITQVTQIAYIARLCDDTTNKDSNADNHNKEKSLSTLLNLYNPEKIWQKTLKKAWKNSFFPYPLPLLSIISHNKSYHQSSAPENYTSEDLASLLANGHIQGITQSITQREADPWWEIDLQDNYIIKIIRLFNGIDLNIENMQNFIIKSSENHTDWITRHHKTNLNLFGGTDGSYYNWLHPLGIKARWIRITVPGKNKVLSLDQIQILGMPCKNFYVP